MRAVQRVVALITLAIAGLGQAPSSLAATGSAASVGSTVATVEVTATHPLAPIGAVAPAGAPGTQLWAARYNAHGRRPDVAKSVAASRDGTKVFVTGSSYTRATATDYATVAYDAVTGTRLWAKRYNNPREW